MAINPSDREGFNGEPNFESSTHQTGQGEQGRLLRWVKKGWSLLALPFRSKYPLGVFFIICVALIWVASSFWIKFIFGELDFNRPYFLTYFNTTLFSLYNLGYLFLPSWRNLRWKDRTEELADEEAVVTSRETTDRRRAGSRATAVVHPESDLARTNIDSNGIALSIELPPDATTNPAGWEENTPLSENMADKAIDGEPCMLNEDEKAPRRYPMYKILHCATFFCFYWFAANYLFNLSLSLTSVSTNTVISSTSSIWTLLFSYLLLHQRVGILKCWAVVLCVGGSALITISESKQKSPDAEDTLEGKLMGLFSAFFYAVYTSVLSKCLPDDDRYSMFMVFGAVGLINLVSFWPGLLVLDSGGYEKFSWPTGKQFLSLLGNSLIGTNLADILWARSVILSSPVVATIGMSLTTPISMIADLVIHDKTFSNIYICGAIMITCGFIIANLPKIKIACFKRF